MTSVDVSVGISSDHCNTANEYCNAELETLKRIIEEATKCLQEAKKKFADVGNKTTSADRWFFGLPQSYSCCRSCGANEFFVCHKSPRPMTCYKCKSRRHPSWNCPENVSGADRQSSSAGGEDDLSGTLSTATEVRDTSTDEARLAMIMCFNCKKRGHITANCTESDRRTCYKCGQKGHISRGCVARRQEANMETNVSS